MLAKKSLIAGVLGGAQPPIIRQLRMLSAAARNNNPHVLPAMSSPPTVTIEGTTRPAWATVDARQSNHTSLWRLFGGTIVTVGGVQRVRSSTIWTTGGNLGSNNGAQGSCWREETVFTGTKIAFVVHATTVPYRFIVDGQYVDKTGSLTVNTSGSTAEYISLDFGSVGTRTVVVEGQQNCGFNGAWLDAAGSIAISPATNLLRGISVGDSYVFGTAATDVADGFAPYMMDCLGIRDCWASSGPGTGWVAATSAYTFGQRSSDWLNFSPDVLFFHGSYNDRNSSTATVTANALSSLQATRASFPNTPIFFLGCFAGASGPSQNILDVEAAVQSAASQIPGAMIKFIPVSTTTPDPWIYGTGTVAAPNGTGNSDLYTAADGVHPTTNGHAYIGGLAADAVIAALPSMH